MDDYDETCTEKRGPFTIAGLVGAICDHIVKGANAHEKEGMR